MHLEIDDDEENQLPEPEAKGGDPNNTTVQGLLPNPEQSSIQLQPSLQMQPPQQILPPLLLQPTVQLQPIVQLQPTIQLQPPIQMQLSPPQLLVLPQNVQQMPIESTMHRIALQPVADVTDAMLNNSQLVDLSDHVAIIEGQSPQRDNTQNYPNESELSELAAIKDI